MDITDFERQQKELQGKTVVVRTHDDEFTGVWTRSHVNTITTDLAIILRISGQEMRLPIHLIESITQE